MLPFAYNGQRYSSCITHDRDGDGNSDNAWCGTTENYDHGKLLCHKVNYKLAASYLLTSRNILIGTARNLFNVGNQTFNLYLT